MAGEHPELKALRQKLEEAESAYAAALAAVDAVARLPAPVTETPELLAIRERLNRSWDRPPPPAGGGPTALVRRRIWQVLAPTFDRQRDFNATVVELLNAHLAENTALVTQLGDLASLLVQYLQRVLPIVDARDRVASALATTRSELILEAFDRRLESLGRRVHGLSALRDRLETISEEVAGIREALSAEAPSTATAAAASQAAEDALYAAFENRFRGSRDELRERFREYVALFQEGQGPVLDLGCGRGEFLDLLREAGLEGRGVEINGRFARECQARGLAVMHGDLVRYLRSTTAESLGGVFAAQVAEHLPPAALLELLREAHRVLRRGGLLLLETVNPRSVVGFLETFNRDLTHQKPLHPETLSFLAAAQGFTDVRVELRSPVDAASRLQEVPPEALPERAAAALNENVARLNALLFGPHEYALLARR